MTKDVPTYKQFREQRIKTVMDEYDVPRKVVEDMTPELMIRPEWVQHLVSLASQGVDIPQSVARTMTDGERYTINKFGYSHNKYI